MLRLHEASGFTEIRRRVADGGYLWHSGQTARAGAVWGLEGTRGTHPFLGCACPASRARAGFSRLLRRRECDLPARGAVRRAELGDADALPGMAGRRPGRALVLRGGQLS